jgi:hypothetical protein
MPINFSIVVLIADRFSDAPSPNEVFTFEGRIPTLERDADQRHRPQTTDLVGSTRPLNAAALEGRFGACFLNAESRVPDRSAWPHALDME